MMNIAIESRDLRQVLRSVSLGIPARPLNPVLEYFLLRCSDGILRVTASSEDMSVSDSCPVSSGEGECLVKARNLLDYVSVLPDTQVTMKTSENHLDVIWENGRTSIPTTSVNEYPVIKEGEENGSVTLQYDVFAAGVKHVAPFVCRDALRPSVCGILLDVRSDAAYMVALDSIVLESYKIQQEYAASLSVILRPAAAKAVLESSAEEVTITVTERDVILRSGTMTVVARQIEGRYPAWATVIPRMTNMTLDVNIRSFLSVLKRMSAMGDDKTGTVTLTCTQDSVTVDAADLAAGTQTQEKLTDCVYSGADFTVFINRDKLRALLDSYTSERITLGFIDNTRPVCVSSETDCTVSIIMPCKG